MGDSNLFFACVSAHYENTHPVSDLHHLGNTSGRIRGVPMTGLYFHDLGVSFPPSSHRQLLHHYSIRSQDFSLSKSPTQPAFRVITTSPLYGHYVPTTVSLRPHYMATTPSTPPLHGHYDLTTSSAFRTTPLS